MMDLMIVVNLCMLSVMLMLMAYKFMLVMLMLMEILVLMVSMMIYFIMGMFNLEVFLIYFLVFMVCESVLGLMILVLIIRFYGNEMYMPMNLYKFI